MKPDVAFFFAARGGGVQAKRVDLANGLAARGFAVEVVMPQVLGEHLKRLRSPVEVTSLVTRNPLSVVSRLARYLRSARPSVLISSQQHTNVAAVLARDLARTKTPLVVTQHNALSEILRASPHKLVRKALPFSTRLLLRRADQILAVSQGVADDLARVAKLDRRRIEVVYNPVIGPDHERRAVAPSGHPWLDEGEIPVVLGAGALVPRKDFETLIRAFSLLRLARKSRLVILGEGPERERLQALACQLGIEHHVSLPGFVTNPLAYMARADVFALSSRLEGMPNVLIEAMACGTPVVSTLCDFGPLEILDELALEHAPLVPVGDSWKLCRAINRVLQSPPPPRILQDRASEFSLSRAVTRYGEIIRELGGAARDLTPRGEPRHAA